MNKIYRIGREREVKAVENHESIGQLREQLIRLKAWPEAGDQFLSLIPPSNWQTAPPTEADREWLPIVVSDVLAGKDIGENHPAFFQRLLMNPQLRIQFIEALH